MKNKKKKSSIIQVSIGVLVVILAILIIMLFSSHCNTSFLFCCDMVLISTLYSFGEQNTR